MKHLITKKQLLLVTLLGLMASTNAMKRTAPHAEPEQRTEQELYN